MTPAGSVPRETDSPTVPARYPWRAIVVIAWLAFGLLAGTLEYLTVYRAAGASWLSAAWSPLLASMIWIPLTYAIVAAVGRWPLWPLERGPLAIHVVLSLSISFVLNFFWGVGAALLTSTGFFGTDVAWSVLMPNTSTLGLRFLHLNGGTYWFIAVLLTVWRHRRVVAPRVDAEWVKTLPVKRTGTTIVVPVDDIDWIEGAGDYARLHVGGEQLLSNQRLKVLERQLDPSVFGRVHRSAIVNLTRIRRLSHRSHGDYLAVLQDGTEIKVARSRRQPIREMLEGYSLEL